MRPGFPTSTHNAVWQDTAKILIRMDMQILGLSAEIVQDRPVYYQLNWLKHREKR